MAEKCGEAVSRPVLGPDDRSGGGPPGSPRVRRGRPPRQRSLVDLPADVQRQILEAIDSDANETAASLYRRFGLAQRGIEKRTFRRFVEKRRLTAGDRPTGPEAFGAEPEPPAWEELDRACRRGIQERLEAGDAKVYEIVGVARAALDRERVEIEKRAERRAEETHEARMREAQERFERAAKAARQVAAADPAAAMERLISDVQRIYGVQVAGGPQKTQQAAPEGPGKGDGKDAEESAKT